MSRVIEYGKHDTESKFIRVASVYDQLGARIKRLEEQREKFSAWMKGWLEWKKQRHVDFEQDKQVYKAQRYPIVKVDWNMKKLTALLKERGLTGCLKIVVDGKALDQAVENGKVSLEDLHACGSVRTGWGLRVDEVKK